MTDIASVIYWAGVFGNLIPIVCVVGITLIILGGGILLNWNHECRYREEDRHITLLVAGSICVAVGIILGITAGFIPSQKTYLAMHLVPAVTTNEKVQQVPDKALDLLNEWLEELRPDKEK